MKVYDILSEDGRIVKGVNTTADVGPNEIKTQAAKFGNTVDKDGVPPTLSKRVKGASTNVAFNLGLTEGFDPVGWLKSSFNPDPQYKAWKKLFKQNPAQAKKMFRNNHRQYLAIYQNESISEKYNKNKLEDQHPNERPLGPETKPTMPAGTIRIKVSDVYDWYKLGQHISDLPNLDKNDFGKGPPEAVISFGSEEEEHKYIKLIQQLGLEILDIDPGAADAPGVETDPTYNTENFADGKVKGKSRPGRVKRAGASCNGSVTALRKRAKNASGEKAKMYHWCANMKSGRK